jgi:hypothetical protein
VPKKTPRNQVLQTATTSILAPELFVPVVISSWLAPAGHKIVYDNMLMGRLRKINIKLEELGGYCVP